MASAVLDVEALHGDDNLAAHVAWKRIHTEYGEQLLQELIEAGITGDDFWGFYKEYCGGNLHILAQLSHEGTLEERFKAWKSQQP